MECRYCDFYLGADFYILFIRNSYIYIVYYLYFNDNVTIHNNIMYYYNIRHTFCVNNNKKNTACLFIFCELYTIISTLSVLFDST